MKALRYLITLLAAAILLYLFWPLLGELRAAARLFREISLFWLLVALACQLAGYACLTALNYWLLQPFPGRIGFWRLMAALPAIAFIEVALPSAGASGVVLRARLLAPSGYSPEASTFTLIMETFFEVVVRVAVSLAGLWYLLQVGDLSIQHLVYLGIGLFLAVAGSVVLWRLAQNQTRMLRWVLAAEAAWHRLLARVGRPAAPSPETIARVRAFYEGMAKLRHVPAWRFWLAAGVHIALDVASLEVCFAAFHYIVPPGTLLTGYGLMLLLSGLAALPGGLGLADASLAVIFARLHAPGAVALAAALLYRLLAFWLLRLVGFSTWQVLEAQRGSRAPDPTSL